MDEYGMDEGNEGMQQQEGMAPREPRRGGREGGRGGGRGGVPIKSNYFLPKPVKVGDEVDVEIEAVASKGDGIAKKDGFVIFIKGAQQGQKIKARITEVKARFAVGEVVA